MLKKGESTELGPVRLSTARQVSSKAPGSFEHIAGATALESSLGQLRELTEITTCLLSARFEFRRLCRHIVRAQRQLRWLEGADTAAEAVDDHAMYVIRILAEGQGFATDLQDVLDKASRGGAKVGRRVSTNAHRAAFELGERDLELLAACGFEVSARHDSPENDKRHRAWLRRMRMPSRSVVEAIAAERPVRVGAVTRVLATEAKRAESILRRRHDDVSWMWLGRELRPLPLELDILKALVTLGKPTPTEPLLAAARLSVDGSSKGILAGMVERGLLDNNSRTGYALPAWRHGDERIRKPDDAARPARSRESRQSEL